MISEKLFSALNDQINFEFYSSYVYLAMASYCEDEDLAGFANFFRVQAQEELFHAMKMYDYVIEMDGKVTLEAIEKPENNYSSVIEAFKTAYSHEKIVTERIYKLTDIATEEREHATISFLKWFIDEQVEEEASFKGIIKQLERSIENPAALYMIDTNLSQRTFTPPTNA
ncbi:ferritin [Hathewaya histolytica]|uniref:Ferritin n=1 Tax=Hathewaya histolytica TaxID=1498 RepID=A0A4U9RWX8_HATHI|nr:ferritin [Hathewaya histolytica]VTQ96226.1 ferritin family protein [Hathewaya histolytica]